MADTTALKNRIRAAIKANDNQEITGPVLQQTLLDIVDELDLYPELQEAINTEKSARQQADSNLQTNINSEATARQNADTQLNNLITGIKNNIDNGYVYAGMATPSATPVSGKVFYVAIQAGTYTNFGNTTITQGITILKYNGTSWVKEQILFTDGGVFDLSAYNNGTTYADLNAALTALNALPAAYKKSGMLMKFVHTSSNKYLLYILVSQNFSANPVYWEKIDEKQLIYVTKSGTSDSSKRFNTSDIFIKNKSYYRISNVVNSSEIYVMWNDETYIRISQNVFYQMEYPEGKTFKCFRLISSTAGQEVSLTILSTDEAMKKIIDEIDSKVDINDIAQRLGSSITSVISQKEMTDELNKQDADEHDDILFNNTANTDIYSNSLTAGKVFVVKLTKARRGGSNYPSVNLNGSPKNGGGWVNLGSVIVGEEKLISLNQDFNFIRLGDGNTWENIEGEYSIYGSYFANRIKKVNELLDRTKDIEDSLAPISETTHRDLDFYYLLADTTATEKIVIDSRLIAGTKIKAENLSESGNYQIYAYRSDNTYVDYGMVYAGSTKIITLGENFTRIKWYANTAQHGKLSIVEYGALSQSVRELQANETNIERALSEIEPASIRFQAETGTASGGQYPQYNSSDISIPNGTYYKVNVPTYSEIYLIWSDGSYMRISKNVLYLMEYPSGKTFRCIRVMTGSSGGGASVTVEVTFIPTLFSDNVKFAMKGQFVNIPEIRVLVLGDSYSAGGGQWCGPMIARLPQGSSYISLAVSSATLRDRSNDRETYPYTDRPVSTDNTGNHNTLGSQIQKLKRLMAGTDLDQGETAIYQTEDTYPNVIIIAAGKNDYYDSDEVVATYNNQLDKVVNNVYCKATSSSTAVLGSATIKTPLDEVNRTCFAGAYRYLMDELLGLFPNAHIYFATVSPISYRDGSDISRKNIKVAEQQRLCSDIFGATLIDWHRDGQINSVANYAQGSGTQEDPYITRQSTLEHRDTNDQLHPNARGGKKYGILAAHTIINTFIEV